MTRPCCTACRIRFAPERATALDPCPRCNAPLETLPADRTIGFALAEIADPRRSLPTAIAAALAPPRPGPADPR